MSARQSVAVAGAALYGLMAIGFAYFHQLGETLFCSAAFTFMWAYYLYRERLGP